MNLCYGVAVPVAGEPLGLAVLFIYIAKGTSVEDLFMNVFYGSSNA